MQTRSTGRWKCHACESGIINNSSLYSSQTRKKRVFTDEDVVGCNGLVKRKSIMEENDHLSSVSHIQSTGFCVETTNYNLSVEAGVQPHHEQ